MQESNALIHFTFSRRFLSLMIVFLVSLLLVVLLIPAVQKAREVAKRAQSKNNLKQIGIALFNYNDCHSTLPPGGTIRNNGAEHHGWMTSLLPFMDSSPDYSMIDFNFPWDSPFNRDIFSRSPQSYINPSIPNTETDVYYQPTHYMGNPTFLHRNSSVSISNHESYWLAGEVAGGFHPFAYPFNWRVWNGTLNTSTTGYGKMGASGANFLFSDGSVQFISNNQSEHVRNEFTLPEISPKPEKTSVPPQTYPSATKMIENTFCNDQPDGYCYLVASGTSRKLSVSLRAFPREKGIPTRLLDTSDIELILERHPEATELIFHGTIDEVACRLIVKFENLQSLYCHSISDQEAIWSMLNKHPKLINIVQKTNSNIDSDTNQKRPRE